MLRTPTAVLMMIGQIEVMKITKIAEGCAVAEGRQRQRQPGQRRHGAQHLEDRIEPAHGPDATVPTSSPSAMPTTAASAKPSATRCRLASRCQNSPLSRPPRS